MTPDNVRTHHYKNDLRRVTALIAAALAFFGLILLAVVAYAGWSANRSAVVRERQLVENALDQSVSRVLNEEKAITWWDDAVLKVQDRQLDIEWLETNFGIWFFETYGHDEVFIVDNAGTPIYANVGGVFQEDSEAAYSRHRAVLNQIVTEAREGDPDGLRARDAAFTTAQERYNHLLGGRQARWAGHILSVDGEPAVVTAIAIVPSVDPTVLRGEPHFMVSIVRVDPEFMVDVGRTLLMDDLTVSTAPANNSAMVSEAFQADDGTPVGYLSWTPKQPGQSLLMFILPLVALGVIGAGFMTWMMIRRLKQASTELSSREAESRHQALHDALSGLPNRRHFVERLQAQLDGVVQSRNNARVVVAYIDVDRFKDINDTLGHQAGDTLIMEVAKRLAENLAPDDFLARFGGDEFAVMRRAADAIETQALSERLRAAFDCSFNIYGQDVRMTASIGVAMAPDHGVSPEELMRHADIALYQGKNQGRDRVMVFCAEMAAEVESRREIEVDLHAALQAHDLKLHYQPLVSCSNGSVRGVEALLRWKHPTKGDISPGVFVPIAEEAGLMPALGAYVLARAFEQAKAWPDIEVAINLSPVQFRHVDLVHLLQRLVSEHRINPNRIVLEVTEGVLMESTDRNRQILEAVREMGFKVALDDFGTGYSSLRYLSDFRFDKIKIDRAFVTDIQERKRALTIIQSVVTLGRGLGMDVVAEGVETEAEASVMRLVGVSELQGFYFSAAVPPEEVQGLIDRFGQPAAPAHVAPVTDLRQSRRS